MVKRVFGWGRYLVDEEDEKGDNVFKGKVIDYDRSTGFLIEFEDGDREDVTHKTLVRRPRLGSLMPRAIVDSPWKAPRG